MVFEWDLRKLLYLYGVSLAAMAIASETKVYKDTYDLLMRIEDLRVNFPKMYKYDFGNEIFMTGVACCELIQSANMTKGRERLEYLNKFIVKFGTLKLLLRIAQDRRIIDLKASADLIVRLDNIGRQITGWKNHTASNPELQSPR